MVLHGLIGALLAFSAERIVHWRQSIRLRRTIREQFKGLVGDVKFAVSMTPASDGGGPTMRTSDLKIREQIIDQCGWKHDGLLPMTPASETLEGLNCNLFIIGSPKFNLYAEMVQKEFETQNEFVWDLYQGEPESRILKIVTRHGDEYVATRDLKADIGDSTVDYGIFFHARLDNGKEIFWLAGIHGPATVGVWKEIQSRPEMFAGVSKTKKGEGQTWFFRLTYHILTDHTKEEDTDNIFKIDPLGSAVAPRRSNTTIPPKAIIFDLGNVLMLFDRSRTYRAIGHWLKQDWKTIRSKIENSSFPRRYESGELNTEEFRVQICGLLKVSEKKLPSNLFAEFWGDIFWANTKMIELVARLHSEKRHALVLLSNTNELHFEDVQNHFPEVFLPFEPRLVLSFREKTDKSNSEIFTRAIKVAGVSSHECVYIDDKTENIEMAKKSGMRGLIYFKYPQLVVRLREIGIYTP